MPGRDYRDIVNDVMGLMRWEPISMGSFAAPNIVGREVKKAVNKAKNQVLTRVRYPLTRFERIIDCLRVVTGTDANGSGTDVYLEVASGVIQFSGSTTGSTKPALPQDMASSVDGVNWNERKLKATAAGWPDQWFRITAVANTGGNNPSLTLDGLDNTTTSKFIPNTSAPSLLWSVAKDEYILPATVRRVTQAWWNDQELEIVDDEARIDRDFTGDLDIADPEELAVIRATGSVKTSTQFLYAVRIRPVPAARSVLRVITSEILGDLSASDDVWEVEPEIIDMIEQSAYELMCNSKIVDDPDQALMVGRKNDIDLQSWRLTNQSSDPTRRFRRTGPRESRRRHDDRRRISGN